MMGYDKRPEIFTTSTGVGHHWRSGYHFPSTNFSSVQLKPLPASLVGHKQVSHAEFYRTTSGSAHDPKHVDRATYGNHEPMFKKAPAHYKMNYNRDLHEKLSLVSGCKPLTMGCQASETHESFRAEPGLFKPTEYHNIRGFLLDNHFSEGPSQKVYPTTVNARLRGRPFSADELSVLAHSDPYLTTNNAFHRPFTQKDLDGYARKDVPTYWDCEDYPKAWGHGQKHNPMPKKLIPQKGLPMVDEMVFKKTSLNRQPLAPISVGHSGLKSEYQDNYLQPSDPRCKESSSYLVNNPNLTPMPSVKTTYSAPNMYITEYQTVGARKPMPV